jgi:hypothetical protein
MDDAAQQRELEGQSFEFAIRFGCGGAEKDLKSVTMGWSYEPQQKTLRVRATPTITAGDPVAAAIGGQEVEAIEGFWVPRPWMLVAACPAIENESRVRSASTAEGNDPAHDDTQPALRWPKVGIAQFFSTNDARTGRRDRRAYEAVRPIEQATPVGLHGFNLVLIGRLRSVPGKRVIECLAEANDAPADCIVSARIDEVRIEQPEGGVLARWSS